MGLPESAPATTTPRTLRIDLDPGGSRRPEAGLWIPAFAGMTAQALTKAFPRKRYGSPHPPDFPPDSPEPDRTGCAIR